MNYLVDILSDVVSATSTAKLTALQSVDPLITAVHYDYGHINDINERILQKQRLGQNFCPMIVLIEDYRTTKKDGIMGISDLKILILYYSKADITRQQREANVFRPILYPLYDEFLKQLKLNGKFNIYDETQIEHDQINRPHWGDPALYGNKEYPLKGVFDGIELANLKLELFLYNCLTGANF